MFFRSDESGTTENFEKYLAAAGDGNYSAAPSKKFGGGVGEGKAKSAGVQQAVKAIDGGIAYMEYSYAKDGALGVAKVNTGAANPISLTAESAGKALAAATQSGFRQRSRAEARLRDEGRRRVPDRPGHLRDRLLEGAGRGEDRHAARLPVLHRLSPRVSRRSATSGYGTLPDDLRTKVLSAVGAITS